MEKQPTADDTMTRPLPYRDSESPLRRAGERPPWTTDARGEGLADDATSAPPSTAWAMPAYNWWNECLHGVGRAGIATVFPQAIGLAATFDTSL